MLSRLIVKACMVAGGLALSAVHANAQLELREDVEIPKLENFQPLPDPDPDFSAEIVALVKQAGLDAITPAADSPDKKDEHASICIVDLSGETPRVGGWEMHNLIYPASTYKAYVLGEAIRQVTTGELTLDTKHVVKEHNVRAGSRPKAGEEMTLSETLRLMIQYSDNTAANEAIDIVDRQRASALLRAMNIEGSDVTRKFLSRSIEDEGYADIAGTITSGHAAATFLYAAETGAIGGGRGRGLIKAYLAMDETKPTRIRGGLPASATVYSKSGWWNTYSSEIALIEDGEKQYIVAIFTALPDAEADERIAEFMRGVHELVHSNSDDSAKSTSVSTSDR